MLTWKHALPACLIGWVAEVAQSQQVHQMIRGANEGEGEGAHSGPVARSLQEENEGGGNAKLSPKISLLMSFPNSGTTYTLANARSSSRRRSATSYSLEIECQEEHQKDGYEVVFHRYQDYPFLYQDLPISVVTPAFHYCERPDQDHLHYERPADLVLTKTHCLVPMAGRVANHSFDQFDKACRKAFGVAPGYDDSKASPGGKWRGGQYPPEYIGNVVHLHRSPFDNVVARYHFYIRYALQGDKSKTPKEKATFARSPQGFQRYCADSLDPKFSKAYQDAPELQQLAKDVPCHSEFYSLVQWHNYANEFIQKYNLEVLEIHYQDYKTDLPGATSKVLDFLHQDLEGETTPFYWSDYALYFNAETREATRRFCKAMASPATWNQIQNYFEGPGIEE